MTMFSLIVGAAGFIALLHLVGAFDRQDELSEYRELGTVEELKNKLTGNRGDD